MNESIRTSFIKHDETIDAFVIDEDRTNADGDNCISLSIEEWSNGNCISASNDLLLNQEEVIQLIGKLQYYCERMAGKIKQ